MPSLFPQRDASGTLLAMARDIDRSGEFVWRDVRGGLNRVGGGAWVETPIPEAPGWYAACLLLRVGEGATLAELRVIPNAGRWRAGEELHAETPSGSPYGVTAQVIGRRGGGEWSRHPKDLETAHASGVTSRMLRKVPLDAIFDEALRRLNEHSRLPKGWDRLGRTGARDDRFYAVWAGRYVEQVTKSSSPNSDLAKRHGVGPEDVARYVHEARNRDILSRTDAAPGRGQQGRRGGVLTAKGRDLLSKNNKGGK